MTDPVITGGEVIRRHRAEAIALRQQLTTRMLRHRQKATRLQQRVELRDAAIAGDDQALTDLAVAATVRQRRTTEATATDPTPAPKATRQKKADPT